MPSFFVGNVLPESNAVGENDPTFDFTKEESANMDLSDVPIRIEHTEGLSVGQVQRHWNDSDGKKWILGKLDDSTLEGRFASNALQPSSDGHRLYTGLSLQHVHTSFSDGSTAKRPIEVSLCTEPRRAGCNVISTQQQSASGQSETKKTEYITQHQASKMSAPIEETQNETPQMETQEQVVETSAAAEATDSQTTNQEDLMKLVINQESELGDTKMALQKAEAQLVKLQEQWKQQQDNAELETKSKAEALSKALVDSWSASLPADMMTDENKKAIFAMAQNYPKESVKMLEIAHKASAKYKTDLDSLASQAQAKSKRALENQVMDIVTKKRRVALAAAPPQQSVVHAASAKVAAIRNPFAFDSSQTQSSSMSSVRDRNPALFEALSGFGSGNLRDRMGQISKIDGN